MAGFYFACGVACGIGFLMPVAWLTAEASARRRIATSDIKIRLLWAQNDFYDVLAKHLEIQSDPSERPRDFVKFALGEAFTEYEQKGSA